MSGYAKLFEGILDSTVWQEPLPTKVVWVTMIAMADQDGIVSASVPGLARRAGVSREQCEAALLAFLSPDVDSRTKDYEGRRIVEVDGGWELLNHAKYRELKTPEERRKKNAERQQRFRERHAVTLLRNGSNASNASSRDVAQNNPSDQIRSSPAPDPKSNSVGKLNSSTAEPAKTPPAVELPVKLDPPLLTFPCAGEPNTWDVTKSTVKRWRELFPGVDIGAECRSALAWVEASPGRMKTARGMQRFLVSWFGRAQNRGQRTPAVGIAAYANGHSRIAVGHARAEVKPRPEGEVKL